LGSGLLPASHSNFENVDYTILRKFIDLKAVSEFITANYFTEY